MMVPIACNVLELAGSPGSGKTSVAQRILGAGNPSAIPRLRRVFRIAWIDRLLVPLTVLRFRRVFQMLSPQHRGPWALTSLGLCVQAMLSGPGGKSDTSISRIVWLVHAAVVERWLATVEGLLRRGRVVLDEGLVQGGIGVWLRSPEAVREAAWQSYIRCLPKGLCCIVLELPPEEAMQRAAGRRRGLLAVARWSGGSDDTVRHQFAAIARLLNDLDGSSSFRLRRIPVSDAGATLGGIFSPNERLFVLARAI